MEFLIIEFVKTKDKKQNTALIINRRSGIYDL